MPRLGAAALALFLAGGAAPASAQVDPNPCLAAPRELLCPDLVMRAPFDLKLDRQTRPGRVLLRAANSIDSLGRGPVELHGRRSGRVTMTVRQAIYRTTGSRQMVSTGGRLGFKTVPGVRFDAADTLTFRYWKFRDAARFELWEVDELDRRVRLVRTGPKVYYCFRDLRRTHASRSSPRRRVYPACNRNSRIDRVVLGTSVGWSDIYPSGYPEQWIDVTGLRGRFAYVHIADPEDGIYESNEDNNASEAIVSLPSGRVLGENEGVAGEPPLGGSEGGGASPPGYSALQEAGPRG
jgi:hypothetical protein